MSILAAGSSGGKNNSSTEDKRDGEDKCRMAEADVES